MLLCGEGEKGIKSLKEVGRDREGKNSTPVSVCDGPSMKARFSVQKRKVLIASTTWHP